MSNVEKQSKKKGGPTSHEEKIRKFNAFLLGVMFDDALKEMMMNKNTAFDILHEPVFSPDDECPVASHYGIQRYHSARLIQDTYGLPIANLFKLCYVQWQKGGRNLKGDKYKTEWRLNQKMVPVIKWLNFKRSEALKVLQDRPDLVTPQSMIYPEHWVNYLKARGAQETYRVKLYDEDGTAVQLTEIMNKGDRREAIKLKNTIRQFYSNQKAKRESLH